MRGVVHQGLRLNDYESEKNALFYVFSSEYGVIPRGEQIITRLGSAVLQLGNNGKL